MKTFEDWAESKSTTVALCSHVDVVKSAYNAGVLAGLEGAHEVTDKSDSYDSMSLTELGAMLKYLKESVEKFDRTKKELQKIYDHLSVDVLPDRMDEDGVSTMKITGIGRLQTQSDIRCNVPAVNREALRRWLCEHGHSSMVQETINSSTLKAFIREQMKEGREYPENLVTVHPYSRATVVKG